MKTSVMVDRGLWERFKREVARRYEGKNGTPPVSRVVEELVRGYVEGLEGERVHIHELAYILSREPRLLLEYVGVNPTLAFRVFLAKPDAFIGPMILRLEPRSLRQDSYEYYSLEDGRIVLYYRDISDKWYPGEEWILLGRDLGEPYFNGQVLDLILGEGYPTAATLVLEGKSRECIGRYLAFSLRDRQGWDKFLSLVEKLAYYEVKPVFIEEKECDGYQIRRVDRENERVVNALEFLRSVAAWAAP